MLTIYYGRCVSLHSLVVTVYYDSIDEILLVAAGLGYGLVSGAFSTVNVYRHLGGPGTVGIHGDSQYFFLITCKQ